MSIQNSAKVAKIEKVSKIKMYKAEDSNTWGWHFHDEYEIIYIEEGSANFTINGSEAVYEKGSIIFIGNLDEHMMSPVKEPYIRYVTIINSGFFEQFVAEPMLCSIFKRRTKNFSSGVRLTEEDSGFVLQNLELSLIDYKTADSFHENYCMASILKILIRLFRHNRAKFPDFANRHSSQTIIPVQKFLDENFSQDIMLDELSSMFFINKYHLSRMFKETTGYSIKHYIMLKRIMMAKDMLYCTGNSISQIAMECGFNSTSNFIRAFKNIEKVTPLCFRKKYRD